MTSPLCSIKKRSIARRCLFGRPDQNKFNETLKKEMEELRKAQNEKWGFDFETLSPLPGSSSQYEYFAINPANVPAYYRTTTMSTPVKSRRPDENTTPETTPEQTDVSMIDSSDSEMISPPKRKSPKKRRAIDQRRITDVFPMKRKHMQSIKMDPALPTSPRRDMPAFAAI